MTPTPNPTAEQAERLSMEVLNEYRKIAAWLEAQAATRGPVGDTMHGLAAEALTNLIEHEYSRHKIPLYGMLDLWMALGVTSHPEFDEFYDEHGYAETWSRLLDGVRRLRRAHGLLSEGAPSEDEEHFHIWSENPCKPGECRMSVPSPIREKLIAEADALIQSWDQRGSWTPDSPVGMVMQLRDALSAQPVLNPEKVAEVLSAEMRGAWRNPVHLARTLCVAYTEGKLT